MKYLKHYRNIVKNKPKAKGGMTIITETTPESIKVGWARCNTVDNYCKKTGRKLAKLRFNESPLVISPQQFLDTVIKHIPELIPAISAKIVLEKSRKNKKEK